MNYHIEYHPVDIYSKLFKKRKVLFHVEILSGDDTEDIHEIVEYSIEHSCNISITQKIINGGLAGIHLEIDISDFEKPDVFNFVEFLERKMK